MKRVILILLCVLMALICTVGYAQLSSNLLISGVASVEPQAHPIYIYSITPSISDGVVVDNHFSTIMVASVRGGSTATFTVTVKNNSDISYVYERIVTGAELDFDDIYSGEGITYSISGITFLTEIGPGETLVFNVTMKVASGVTENNVYTYFKFIEKTGEEILPDGETTAETTLPEIEETTERPEIGTEETVIESEPPTEFPVEPPSEEESETAHTHSDMLGLAEALRSSAEGCLNDSDVIWNAVQTSITKHRPTDMPAMVHCLVQSISGGNMVTITNSANDKLKSGNIVHFVIAADEENENRLFLYMYYEDNCHDGVMGKQIETYLQVLTRADENSDWKENGTYKGMATVAEMWGGGNKNDYRITIDPRTWYAISATSIE